MEIDATLLYNYAALAAMKKENPEAAEILEVFLEYGITLPEALDILERLNAISERFSHNPGPLKRPPQIDPKA